MDEFDFNSLKFPDVNARHAELSMIFSADDEAGPSEYLLKTVLNVLKNTFEISLESLSGRLENPPKYPNVWPGEHYKILASFVKTLKPKLIIEIGTATGLSALAMKKFLRPESKIVTFDIIKWQEYPGSVFIENDFADQRIIQYIDDLSDFENFIKYRELFEESDLIFLDAAKDGIMEQKFLDNFQKINFRSNPLLILDDIRVWNMLKIWRDISLAKLDITSFGHWSGTGLVQL